MDGKPAEDHQIDHLRAGATGNKPEMKREINLSIVG
jgi:hypothetical protein